jgi:capsular exopolysaccharide synthesis family protein
MSEDQFFNDKPQSNILVQILHRYLPFWPVLVIFLTISLGISYIYLRSQTKIYVAAAKVLLKDPQKGAGDSKVLDALNIFSEKKIVENEIIVLRSTSLMQEVVKQLDLYTTVYNKGNVQTEELYGDNAPLYFQALNKDSIVAGGNFSLDIDWNKERINLGGREFGFHEIVKIANTDYRVIINPAYNRQAIGKNYFVIFNDVPSAAAGIIGSLNATPLSYSSTVIDLNIKTPVPSKGIRILNKLFEVYNIEAVADKNQIATRTLNFIEDRLKEVTRQLDSVEAVETGMRSNMGITDLSEQGRLYFGVVKELDQRKDELGLQSTILNATESYINNKGRKPGTVPSLQVATDPILADLLQQLYVAEVDLTKSKAIAGDKSEAVTLGEENIAKIKRDIKENIGNIRQNYNIESAGINRSIAENNSMLSQIPAQERALLAVKRQQEIKNNIYLMLLNKKEETAISSASTTPDLRVLENGFSYGPISPVAKNYYLMGLLCGLIAFLLLVQIREPLNNKILFRTEIENKTKVPVVAEIIQTTQKNNIAISEGKRTVIAEQFRALRTNLSFMGLNEQNKTILVTSSISGEGKSFVATNLALSITLTGKKVALLEMDLRKPKLSRELHVKRDPGISGYLIGKSTLDEIIKPTAFPNLFLVTAGPIPPNPTELIGRPTFAKMMEEIKERFDYVIIDSAPIGPVTDSQLLNPYANITAFVVRHDVTPTVFMKMVEGLNRDKKFSNMCIIFNGVKPRGSSFLNYGFGGYGNGYGYGFGYGYGYGYGYGSEATGYYTQDESHPGFKNIFGFTTWLKRLFRRRSGR